MDFLDIRFDIVWNYRELFIRGVGITLALTAVGYIRRIYTWIICWNRKVVQEKVDLLSFKILC